MNTSECRLSVQISAYIDKELSRDEESLVRDHIEECSQCQAQFQRLSAVVSEASSLPKVKPDGASYITNLRARIGNSHMSWLPGNVSSFYQQLAVAGISLLLIGGAIYHRNAVVSSGSSKPPVEVASSGDKSFDIPGKTNSLPGISPEKTTVAAKVEPTSISAVPLSSKEKNGEDLHGPENITSSAVIVPTMGDSIIASAVVDGKSDYQIPELQPLVSSSSGIDWNTIDLKKASASTSAKRNGKAYPPVYSSFEQLSVLYGNLCRDYSGSIDGFDESTITSGGIVILDVNDQTRFWPSLYRHLLNDDDFEVRFVAYNQYKESKIIIDYKGHSEFEKGFASFAARVETLSSVVGLLVLKTGESNASVLTITVRPAELPLSGL